jgi:hypothetical protein
MSNAEPEKKSKQVQYRCYSHQQHKPGGPVLWTFNKIIPANSPVQVDIQQVDTWSRSSYQIGKAYTYEEILDIAKIEKRSTQMVKDRRGIKDSVVRSQMGKRGVATNRARLALYKNPNPAFVKHLRDNFGEKFNSKNFYHRKQLLMFLAGWDARATHDSKTRGQS